MARLTRNLLRTRSRHEAEVNGFGGADMLDRIDRRPEGIRREKCNNRL
jgi:hypothetical protein